MNNQLIAAFLIIHVHTRTKGYLYVNLRLYTQTAYCIRYAELWQYCQPHAISILPLWIFNFAFDYLIWWHLWLFLNVQRQNYSLQLSTSVVCFAQNFVKSDFSPVILLVDISKVVNMLNTIIAPMIRINQIPIFIIFIPNYWIATS